MKHTLKRMLCLAAAVILLAGNALAYEKLQQGDKNSQVLSMQQALRSLGYSITPDGSYGPATVNVVKSFQRNHNLTADGIAGNKTLTLLYSLAPSYAPGGSQAPESGGNSNSGSGNSSSGGSSASLIATVKTTGGSLNLRIAPNGNAQIIHKIPNASKVIVSQKGSSWCQVAYNGLTGYVMTSYLSFSTSATSAPTPTHSPTPAPTAAPSVSQGVTAIVSTTGGSLNLRSKPSGGNNIIGSIPNGTKLTLSSRGTTWCTTTYNGIYGYVMTQYLTFPTSQTASPTPTVSPTPTATVPVVTPNVSTGGVTAYVKTTGGSLNLREQAKSGTKVLTTIPNGTKLMITARGTTWCATSYNGHTGYVMTSYLSFAEVATPTPSPTPTLPPATESSVYALVTTSGGTLNLRQTPSSSAKVLAKIPNSTTLLVTARGSDWCAVTYAGTSGYVMTSFLTFFSSSIPVATEKPGAEETDPSQYTRTLRKGMTGDDVTWVQGRLAELGYSTPKNGVYDDDTIAAVKAFQSQNALTSDGIAGSQTFAVLNSDNARRADDAPLNYTTLRIDDSKSGVYAMQKRLKELGYNLTVNSTFDEATHNAVVAFQQRNSLVISGIADPLTQQVLYSGNAKPYSTPVEELPADAGKIAGPSVSEIKLLHWQDEIKPKVSAGQTITVFDPNTNLSWKIKFYSLGRHADSEPLTWRDTQIMNRSFGKTSWNIHPVYVLLPTGQWTMATMHNNPHLYGSINDNGFGGHLCIHFLRDMDECTLNDPNYGVNNQKTLRSAWKALTGETVE